MPQRPPEVELVADSSLLCKKDTIPQQPWVCQQRKLVEKESSVARSRGPRRSRSPFVSTDPHAAKSMFARLAKRVTI
jgi:hypothetical protein